jgi:WD repeat-containing protein 48
LARDGPEDGTEVRAGCEGITQLIAQDDSWVWTAGGSSSVKRWKDVAPRNRRAGAISLRTRDSGSDSILHESNEVNDSLYGGQRTLTPPVPESPPEVWSERDRSGAPGAPTVSFLEGLTTTLSRTTSSPGPHSIANASQFGAGRPSSLRTRPTPSTARPPLITPGSSNSGISSPTTLFDIPYDSLVPLTSPDDSYFSPAVASRARDPDVATIYSSISALAVPQFGAVHPPNTSAPSSSYRRPQSLAETTHETGTQSTNIARREYIERESCSEATPLRTSPDDVIEGVRLFPLSIFACSHRCPDP